MHFVGIDFGTTNSAVAIARPGEAPELVSFPGPKGQVEPLWRTVLHFAQEGDGPVLAGAPAIERYVENGGEGRLLQSIKSHLASASFSRTQIISKLYGLEDLISTFLLQVRQASPVELGSRAVVGRPVRYWGADTDADDARAVERMRAALAGAGFTEVVFEYEPVAAAARHASRLTEREVVLVADFGGGTSDFSLLRLGPDSENDELLGTAGKGIGGDTFDGHLVDHAVAPALGKGTRYLDGMGADTPVPGWLYTRLRRWHHLSFLKTRDTMALLSRIEKGSLARDKIGRFLALVEEDLGLPLHQSVERAKKELSEAEGTHFAFHRPPVDLDRNILRGEFEDWISPEIEKLHAVLDELFASAGVDEGQVDRVFATGGSSFVPAVRIALASRYGFSKLVGGDELTSVAWGLADKARKRWG